MAIMSELFEILVDRLQGGTQVKIDGRVDPGFLEVSDCELQFPQPLPLQGSAYLADDHLVINLSTHLQYQAYCKICNELAPFSITLDNIYMTEVLEKISSKKYNFQEPLRETLLLEIPNYHECVGKCPAREELKKFLRSE